MKKNVTQIELYLVIYGDDFSPNILSEITGILPTYIHFKGEKIPLMKGLYRKENKTLYRKETLWKYSTGFIETLDFEDVSEQFVNVLREKITVINNFISQNNLYVSVNAVIEIADDNVPSIHINKQLITLSKKLKTEIDIDMYLLKNHL
ncbi:hypothetical protein FACS1894180_4320 [Bacteroidia bacterium]|nr:hypothetical protein FACS1894180_4320 [Bacteroidia bacterium]